MIFSFTLEFRSAFFIYIQTRTRQTYETSEICIPKKLQTPEPVSEKKYQGLIDLWEKLVIPRQYHVYYAALHHGKVIPEEHDYQESEDEM